ncbi:MAG: hypothetical protein U0236_05310 [Nitrospira sp.]
MAISAPSAPQRPARFRFDRCPYHRLGEALAVRPSPSLSSFSNHSEVERFDVRQQRSRVTDGNGKGHALRHDSRRMSELRRQHPHYFATHIKERAAAIAGIHRGIDLEDPLHPLVRTAATRPRVTDTSRNPKENQPPRLPGLIAPHRHSRRRFVESPTVSTLSNARSCSGSALTTTAGARFTGCDDNDPPGIRYDVVCREHISVWVHDHSTPRRFFTRSPNTLYRPDRSLPDQQQRDG